MRRGPVLMTLNNEIPVSYSRRIDKITTSPDLCGFMPGNLKRGYREIWDITQEMGFHQLAKTLFVTGKLSELEHSKLQRFNSTRNRVVHKFLWEPYEKDYKGVPKREFDEIFQAGISLVNEMDGKAATVLWRRQKKAKGSSIDELATGTQSEAEE